MHKYGHIQSIYIGNDNNASGDIDNDIQQYQ